MTKGDAAISRRHAGRESLSRARDSWRRVLCLCVFSHPLLQVLYVVHIPESSLQGEPSGSLWFASQLTRFLYTTFALPTLRRGRRTLVRLQLRQGVLHRDCSCEPWTHQSRSSCQAAPPLFQQSVHSSGSPLGYRARVTRLCGASVCSPATTGGAVADRGGWVSTLLLEWLRNAV